MILRTALITAFCLTLSFASTQAADVVAFWGFASDYDFPGNPNKQDFAADAGTAMATANLQAFLGLEDLEDEDMDGEFDNDELDNNGGGGFLPYTSPTSGITYQPTRTVKWDDLKGGGDDFDIGGQTEFAVDKKDGQGALAEDFGNDALMYITLDGTGYSDFELRFDIEGTPGDLPSTFDVFYRVGGTGTWFREFDQDEIDLNFMDYDPIDDENQFARSGQIPLAALLNNQSQIEIIVNDFAENGNGEMEIDNIEIIGTAVPEPSSALLALAATIACGVRLRRRR